MRASLRLRVYGAYSGSVGALAYPLMEGPAGITDNLAPSWQCMQGSRCLCYHLVIPVPGHVPCPAHFPLAHFTKEDPLCCVCHPPQGYYCRHLYEESSLAQAEAVLGSEGRGAYASKLALKNEDAVVAAVLAAAGLEVQVLRLLQIPDVGDR